MFSPRHYYSITAWFTGASTPAGPSNALLTLTTAALPSPPPPPPCLDRQNQRLPHPQVFVNGAHPPPPALRRRCFAGSPSRSSLLGIEGPEAETSPIAAGPPPTDRICVVMGGCAPDVSLWSPARCTHICLYSVCKKNLRLV